MLNLGRYISLFLFFTYLLLSKVVATLDRDTITNGSEARLTITAYGKEIEEPTISKIEGFDILSVSTETFFTSINGKVTQGKKFYYIFAPDRNITIQPITFIVDGKVEKTKPLSLRVVEPKFSKDDPFILEISTDKDSYYLGEPIKLHVHYQEDLSQDVIDRRYSEPSSDSLWLKYKSPVRDRRGADKYHVYIDYIFTPQSIGDLHISGAKMKVGTRARRRDSWGFFFETAKWHDVISQGINLKVLPSPTKIVGDFNISLNVDKSEIKSGEAVNLVLKIVGSGNIEDIQPFKIDIQNGIVYDEKPEIAHTMQGGKYIGTFTQKFAVVLDKSEDIPQISFEYFNPQTKKIVTKRTHKISIKVLQSPKIGSENVKIERGSDEVAKQPNISNLDRTYLYIISLLSFLGGILVSLIWFLSPIQKLRKWKVLRNILNRDRELFKLLLPKLYSNSEIVPIAEKLERKIYHGEKVKISKREIREFI
ncbi:MAG TPA: hypothetical protein EYO61_01580 [Campylobacterales bacterium]|nr:hypothetical protein [Campylobacterales bacterium]